MSSRLWNRSRVEISQGFFIIALAFTLPIVMLFYFLIFAKVMAIQSIHQRYQGSLLLEEKIRNSRELLVKNKDFDDRREEIIDLSQRYRLMIGTSLDSYYLSVTDAILIPNLLSNFAPLREASLQRRERFVGISLYQRRRIGIALGWARDQDKNFYGEDEIFQQNLVRESSLMFDAVQKMINNHGTLRPSEVDELIHFWLFVNATLQRMLQQELKALRFQLWSLSSAAVAAWFSCVAFTFFFSRALLQRHKRLEAENRQQSLSLMVSAKMSSLGEMAGNIAHEINSPLAAIRLNAEILQELLKTQPFPQERAMGMTNTLIKMVDKISKIISSMLNFARNAEGEAMTSVKVNRLIEDVLLISQDALKKNSIPLQVKVDEALEVRCRPSEVSQVLLNLIKNSIDALEDLPEKWIRVEAQKMQSRVLIEVIDSGRGIPPELRQRIFEPFFSTKPPGKGTGLGLGIAKKLIEANKGSLSLDEHSEHTCFVVELPSAT